MINTTQIIHTSTHLYTLTVFTGRTQCLKKFKYYSALLVSLRHIVKTCLIRIRSNVFLHSPYFCTDCTRWSQQHRTSSEKLQVS